ncbi:hypothetical protein SAY87_013310 [Trapa incisa]|uniref:DNL-type domain-containing protein n=1 Tax=Trapa incisa TaxID=236973 RepID=A0AAN7KD49_9MYRT|nr:hypothetical protein SAY87_013310 [Trapa incisa]
MRYRGIRFAGKLQQAYDTDEEMLTDAPAGGLSSINVPGAACHRVSRWPKYKRARSSECAGKHWLAQSHRRQTEVSVSPPRQSRVFNSSMADTVSSARFSLLHQAAAQRQPNSYFNTKRNVRLCGSVSASTVYSLQRFGCFPTSSGQEKWRHRRSLAVCASLEDTEDENDQEAAINCNTDSGVTVDLKLPRRRLLVQFTCNECGERTSRLVNRLAYERGLVYVQCAGCLRHHKLVDNLGLVMEFDLREETNAKLDAD